MLTAPWICGCKPKDQVRHYRAERIPVVLPPATDGMLGAIVSRGDAGWFFKLAGPVAAVDAQRDAFRKFVESIRFEEDKPRYEPPPEWRSLGPSGLRYETFQIPSGDEALELTVSTLPKPPGEETSFLLSNINRWRNQMGLEPIEADQLSEQTVSFPLDGSHATLVSLVGKLKASGMTPPFAGGRDGQ